MKGIRHMRIARPAGAAVFGGMLMWGGEVMGGRPLAVDDADPAAPWQLKIEAGGCHEHASDGNHWGIPIGISCGLPLNIEAGVGFGGQFEERKEVLEETGLENTERHNGVGDLVIGAKWRFLESCPLGARHALAPQVKFPTANEDKGLGNGKTDYDLTWIVSRDIGEKAGAHLNLGYSWIGGDGEDEVHYGLALDYKITDAVQWVGEVFAGRELTGGADTVVQFNTGLRWDPVEGITLDIAGGSKIRGDAPDFTATAGLTWAFDFHNAQGK